MRLTAKYSEFIYIMTTSIHHKRFPNKKLLNVITKYSSQVCVSTANTSKCNFSTNICLTFFMKSVWGWKCIYLSVARTLPLNILYEASDWLQPMMQVSHPKFFPFAHGNMPVCISSSPSLHLRVRDHLNLDSISPLCHIHVVTQLFVVLLFQINYTKKSTCGKTALMLNPAFYCQRFSLCWFVVLPPRWWHRLWPPPSQEHYICAVV